MHLKRTPPKPLLKHIKTSSKVVLEELLDVPELLPEVLDLSWRSWTCPGGPGPVLELNKDLQEEPCFLLETSIRTFLKMVLEVLLDVLEMLLEVLDFALVRDHVFLLVFSGQTIRMTPMLELRTARVSSQVLVQGRA